VTPRFDRRTFLAATLLAACADDRETCLSTEATCPGAAAPGWVLEDVQPRSPRFGQRYGLASFRGQVVLLALIDSLCSYCDSQADKLNTLALELNARRAGVQVVGLSFTAAAANLPALLDVASYPIFQDEDAVGAVDTMGGGSSDLFIYDRRGRLQRFLRTTLEPNVFLYSAAGYASVRDAVLAVAEMR
jgi:hypothetical protein